MLARFLIVVCLASFAGLLSCGPSDSVAGKTQANVIRDPTEYADRVFSNGLGLSPPLTVYREDLDHDGVPEVFIMSQEDMGSAGVCRHLVFKRQGDGYLLIGEVDLSPNGHRVLPLAADGSPQLVTYERMGSAGGMLIWIAYRSGRFVRTQTEWLDSPGDNGTEAVNRRWREVIIGK